MTHINPGTDTTINPVVIDDSYRERKHKGMEHCDLASVVFKGDGVAWIKCDEIVGDCFWIIDHGKCPKAHPPTHPPEAAERYTGACAMEDNCTDYADYIESIMEDIDNDDDIPCPIRCAKRTNPNQPTEAQKPRPPCEECIYQAKAAEAQHRIDALEKSLKWIVKEIDSPNDWETSLHNIRAEAIALLQAGDPK